MKLIDKLLLAAKNRQALSLIGIITEEEDGSYTAKYSFWGRQTNKEGGAITAATVDEIGEHIQRIACEHGIEDVKLIVYDYGRDEYAET